jgi:secreted trypsin-like serine protease
MTCFGRRGLAVMLVAGLAACGQDEVETTAQRIVGGSATSELPAVGALVYYGSMHCTGTLIAPRKVVTAAHCAQGVSASGMKFVLGASISSPQASLQVATLKAHPSFSSSSLTNDIALVTLAADAPVAPLVVLTEMDSSFVGRKLLFVGYGVSNGVNQTGAGQKRAVWMSIAKVSATSFSYQDAGRNTCNGDSGGPAFVEDASGAYLVAGVTSYGDATCQSYGVDTRVDPYLAFLGVSGGGGSTTPTTPTDPCQGESYQGRCDGDTVVWCENSQVYKQGCAAKGMTCAYDSGKAYYACAAPPSASDPCQGETWEGRCDGSTLIWCESDQIKKLACSKQGKSCGFDQAQSYYNCL